MPVTKFGLPDHPDETFVLVAAPERPGVADDDETRTLAMPPSRPTPNVAASADAGSSAYRLLERIGQGGAGEVWEAEQASLGRVIAVKRLRHRDDRHALVAEDEFRSESVIAASLEHPNILPVYDLGRGAGGELLLAMKRVRGRPWKELLKTDFAGMDVEGFLARHVPILVAVTQAVAFAHSRGIIHRDIKPAQVLVGAFGEVLLTDWGLAIEVGAEGVAQPSFARRAVPTTDTATNPAGTPSLMAPEQTENHGGNLGPWTDVYLLGGTLYYLLTGSYPHAVDSSAEAFERARAGDRVQSPGARVPDRAVPAELERLCMQALEPERTRRVPSTEAFLEALQDYLSGAARKEKSAQLACDVTQRLEAAEPDYATCTAAIASLDEARRLWPDNPAVPALRQRALHRSARLALKQDDLSFARLQCEAMAPGEQADGLRHDIDRRRKAVARRRLLLRVSTAAVCGLLVVIAAGALLFSRRMQAANEEIAQRAQAAEDALGIARTRGAGAFGLINYVLDDLKNAMDEELTPKRGITFDARNEISQAIAGKVADPVVKYFEAAKPDSWPRDMQLEQATQMLEVGKHFNDMTRYDEARRLLEPALAMREKLLGKQSIEVADALTSLALERQETGEFGQAEAMIRRATAIAGKRLDPDDPKNADYFLALAGLFDATRTDVDQLEQALELYRRAAVVLKKSHDPRLAATLTKQGRILDYMDRPAEAETVLRQALATWKATHAPDDPDVAYVLSSLASSLLHQNRVPAKADKKQIAEAEALLRRAIDILGAALGPDHPNVLDMQSSLARILENSGRGKEAEAIHRKVIASYEAVYGPDNFRTGRKVLQLGFFLYHGKRLPEAEAVLRRAIKNLEASLGPDYLEVGWGYQFLGFVLRDTHRPRQAEAALKRSIEILSARRGPDHPETKRSEKALAGVEAELAKSGAGARQDGSAGATGG